MSGPRVPLSLTLKVRIGRKDTVRLPKSVVKALKLNPRRKVLVNVLGNIATLQSLPDPLELVLTGRKFAGSPSSSSGSCCSGVDSSYGRDSVEDRVCRDDCVIVNLVGGSSGVVCVKD